MGLSRKSLAAIATFALSVAWAAPARATVSLKLSDNDATPSSVSVIAGQSFTVTASLISTAEAVTGVDYYLTAPLSAAGKFRIVDRNITGSSFSDAIKPDAGDNNLNGGVEDSNFSLISVRPGNAAPRNALDLGASIANVGSPLTAGAYVLGTYTISVASDITPGTYTLATTSDSGTGWVSTAPLFNESAFAAHGSFNITIAPAAAPIPEPATLSLIALAGLTTLSRRRR